MSWYKNGSHEAVVCLSGEKKQARNPSRITQHEEAVGGTANHRLRKPGSLA